MKPITINLLSAEDRAPSLGIPLEAAQQLDPALLGVAAAGLVALLGLPPLTTAAIDHFLVNPAQDQSDALARQISQNKGAGRQVQQLQADVNSREHDLEELQGLVGQGGAWAGTLEELRSLTPTDLWLTSLISKDNHVDLTGEALAYKDVAYFYTNLQNAHHFTTPILHTISMTTVGTQPVVQFSLKVSLVSAGQGP